MAFADTAKLVVDLSLKGNFASQLKTSERALSSFNTRIDRTSTRAYKAGQQIGTGIKSGAVIALSAITALTGVLALSVKEGADAAKVQTVFAKAIANSGKVSASYVAALNAQQKALENLAGVDDELIKTEQTRLIQMGLTGKQVLSLTPAILDLSKATGIDLLTATKAVGKAANGSAGALQRYGVFVDKAKFKTDPFGATLDALNKKFGGTTKALSGDLPTRLAAFHQAIKDIEESAGQKLLPVLTRIVDVAGKQLVPAFGKFIDRVMPTVLTGLNQFADLLSNGGAEKGIRAITDALIPLVDLVKVAAAPVKAIVGAFLALPKEVQTVLVGAFAVNKLTGGLVTNVAGGLIESIGKAFLGGIKAPLVNVEGGVVNVNGAAGGGVPSVLGGLKGLLLGSGIVAAVVAEVIALTDARNKNQPIIDAGHQAGLTPQEIAAQIAAANPAEAQTILKRAGITQQQAADALKSSAKKLDAAGDGLEGARGALMEALHPTKRHGVPQPGATQHTPGDTQGGMEAQRGAMGDRLFADELAKVSKSTDIESLRGNIATGLTTSAATIGGDIETMRGSLADGLVSTQSAVNVGAQQTSGATTAAGQNVAITTASGASRIVAAVNAIPAPQTFVDVNISASSVTSVTTKTRRKGPSGGSRSDDLRDYKNGMGGG